MVPNFAFIMLKSTPPPVVAVVTNMSYASPSPHDSHLLTHVDHSHRVEDAKDQEEDQGDAEDLKLLTEKINLEYYHNNHHPPHPHHILI